MSVYVFEDVSSYVEQDLKEVCTGRSLVPTQMTILVSVCQEKREER